MLLHGNKKVIGAIYKIPLTNVLGTIGRSYYSTAYNLHSDLFNRPAAYPLQSRNYCSIYCFERYNDVSEFQSREKGICYYRYCRNCGYTITG